jgi:hypothetical protein
MKLCKYCQKEFKPTIKGFRKYCSKECKDKFYTKQCKGCGKDFISEINTLKIGHCQLFCSKECRELSYKQRIKDIDGYIRIRMPKHPNCDRDGLIREHRYIIEQNIGRYLKTNEHVHHINGIRDDNRIENLQLLTQHQHCEISPTKFYKGQVHLYMKDPIKKFIWILKIKITKRMNNYITKLNKTKA